MNRSLLNTILSLRKLEIKSKYLIEESIALWKQHGHLNCIIEYNEKDALDKAAEVDIKLANLSSSDSLPIDEILLGVPISIKDNFCMENYHTTAASRMLETFKSPYDATIVSLIKRHGGIPCAKTNMDEFGMGSTSTNSIHGAVISPIKSSSSSSLSSSSLSAGGSSGGAAVAVVSNIVSAAIGSDTGGSVRQPASFTGLFGFKPSYGTLSRYGLLSYASSMDTPGIITHNAIDAAILYDMINEYDSKDSTSDKNIQRTNALHHILNNNNKNSVVTNNNTSNTTTLADLESLSLLTAKSSSLSLEGVVVGVPEEVWVEGLDDNVSTAIMITIDQLEKQGAHVIPVKTPLLKAALPCYYVLACAEASSNLMRYDGVRYGYRATTNTTSNNSLHNDTDTITSLTSFQQEVSHTRGEAFGSEVIRRILTGTFVLSESQASDYYDTACTVRKQITSQLNHVMTNVDVLLLPTVSKPPFSADNLPDNATMLLYDAFTVPANLAGLPAVSIPISNDVINTPIGIQLMGKIGTDAELLRISTSIEQKLIE